MQPPKINICIRCVIIQDNKLLGYYTSVEDFYFYIGGKIEYGETLEDAWSREIKEELGENATFTFKKILYVRDFIKGDNHTVEFYILGDTNVGEEIEGRPDPEHDGKAWPTWLDLNNLPENLYPKGLSQKLKEDFAAGFPHEGEYIGKID